MFSLFHKKTEQPQPAEMVSPRRKPISQIFYEEKSARLPVNFAQNIMDLEMQLEFTESYNLEVVMKLNELYKIAIQHYINEDPRKANHFQKKLTSLLTNPQTLQLMDQKALQVKQSLEKSVKSPSRYNNGSGASCYSSNLRKQLSQFQCQSEILVKSIIEGTEKKLQRGHRFVEKELVGQEERLKFRLEQRSRSKKQRNIDIKQQ